ncbi:hypothetical protein [Anaerocellum diazotrophicum]|uniref:Double Cache domain-containing protein n=1 Tax=Caldicellulosiruptor diazotrophicus TaxID=2806205 RepID=A0ABM7NK12_9FIRM|nr:hypothetical protein [Caldicellulosiruptor diazotrophicus]BCS80436.1 hypothetical protein CaldiYA01_03960 [Caldicellulosiruptor diazotrophicus]
MKKGNILLIIILAIMLIQLFGIPILAYEKFDSIINHNEEIMKLRRELTAESHLNALLELLNRDNSFIKKQLDEITGNKVSYDFKKFKISDEYEVYRLFEFPYKSKLASNGYTRIFYFEEDIRKKIENLEFSSFSDLLKKGFVKKEWARIIYYDDKPVGYMLIGWDNNNYSYVISYSTMGYSGLGEAIIFMREFLRSKGQPQNVKIVDAQEKSLYVASEDGNWWCTDAADSSNPEIYRKKIWHFDEIKDGLNNRPKEILNYFDEMQKDPDNIKMGGSPYKPLFETATEKKEKIKNVLVATLLLSITAIFVAGVNLLSKYKKRVSIH